MRSGRSGRRMRSRRSPSAARCGTRAGVSMRAGVIASEGDIHEYVFEVRLQDARRPRFPEDAFAGDGAWRVAGVCREGSPSPVGLRLRGLRREGGGVVMATKTITIEVEECPVNGCDEAGESALEPHFCRKHAEAFYGSAEGEAARYEREKQQAEFIARLNGTHTRNCMNCDRWGT